MALQLKLKNTNNINEEGNRVYLEDSTGTYSLTNLGGYGLPNITRESIALFVLSIYKSSKGDVIGSLEPYNPATATKFNVITPKDGWYVFQLISVEYYNSTSLQIVGEVRYDYDLNKLVVYTLEGTIKEVELSTLKDSKYVGVTTDTLFIANSSKTKLKVNAQISDALFNGADFNDKKLIRYKDNYNAVRSILQGAIYEFCRGNKYVAQKNIEFLNSNNYVLD